MKAVLYGILAQVIFAYVFVAGLIMVFVVLFPIGIIVNLNRAMHDLGIWLDKESTRLSSKPSDRKEEGL